jgi:hypothetical protein
VLRWMNYLLPVLAIVAAASVVRGAAVEELSPLRYHHPWGRFGHGSWQSVRMVTEAIDEQGQVTSVSTTETKTTLDEVTAEGVKLRVEVTMDVAGKRLITQPQFVRQGFTGAVAGQNVSQKKLGPTSLTIGGQQVNCESQELEVLGQGQKRVSLICFAETNPHILRRKVVATETANPAGGSESTAEVIDLDMPYKVVSEVKNAAVIRTVQRDANGTTITLSINVPEVPGEVVAHTSKKLDAKGHLVRRSTLELVGYGAMPLDATTENQSWTPRRHRARRQR